MELSATNSEPLLTIRDLAVRFTGRADATTRAVDGVSLTVYPRQTVAVVGESGSGKSVTALSVLRLLPAPPAQIERGRIEFRLTDGPPVNLLEFSEAQMRQVRGGQIAMIFQEPMTSLNPVFTVGDQIAEAVRLHRAVSKAQARGIAIDAMAEVGIADPARRLSNYPHQFSGGMRQRVMIAMALACQPKLLLADEPTTALDVTVQAQILDLLAQIRDARGLAILLITHDLSVVARHADVVCVMYAGRVMEYARVDELYARPLHPYTIGLLACIPRLGVKRDRLMTVREVIDDRSRFALQSDGRPTGLTAWWPTHPAPADYGPGSPSADGYALREVAPGHWVGVWNTSAATPGPAADQRPPDLAYRKPAPPRERTA